MIALFLAAEAAALPLCGAELCAHETNEIEFFTARTVHQIASWLEADGDIQKYRRLVAPADTLRDYRECLRNRQSALTQDGGADPFTAGVAARRGCEPEQGAFQRADANVPEQFMNRSAEQSILDAQAFAMAASQTSE